MSGSLNVVSGASSGSSNGRRRGKRFAGVPKKCWCGESIIPLMSKSTPNPYRKYFRCLYAATQRLENDEHIFKWIDEAILEDLESLESKNASIEQHVKEIAREILSLEQEVLDRVEEVLAEEKTKMKKMMAVIFSGCAICVVSMVLLVKKW
ncbi:uncharacterized protein At4g04775-like [Raphanus sativus]|uniref:Uncharacterized protein At4g04775-like n=1 Tax=Raphanus sativus TaxID=3726 RepID=A0A6J0K7J5_RAPSA|nr:uncharacterized protein At4g04775-like [Raphanus sativus]